VAQAAGPVAREFPQKTPTAILAPNLLLFDAKGDREMVMFLMVLCMSVFGLAISALAFGAATRGLPVEQEAPLSAAVDERLAAVPERFFVRDAAPQPVPAQLPVPRVPIEVFLAQIERHIRLEQAAAESFLIAPSPESLHGRTVSPLVH
jgi:hypothetical protein